MSLTKIEQETIMSFNEAEGKARVYTHNAALQKKLKQLQGKFPAEVIFEREEPNGGAFYTIPKRWFKIATPRALSNEERARLSAHAKEVFSRKSKAIAEGF